MPEPSPIVDALARRAIGAALEVHRALGPGYPEQAYQRAMELELTYQRIPFASQVPLGLTYKDEPLGTSFRLDLLVDGMLLVELKTVESIGPIHVAQVISYLKASNLPLGLILNFQTALMRDGIRRVLPPPRPYQSPIGMAGALLTE